MGSKFISLAFFIILMSASLIPVMVDSPSQDMLMIVPASTMAIPLPEITATETLFSTFVQNAGQLDNPYVLFYSTMGNLAFTNNSFFIYSSDNTINETASQRSVVSFSFIGANDASPAGLEPTQWTSNYFLGNDSEKWQSGVPNFRGLVYKNIWDGIDLEYRMDGSQLKYQFIVHPGSDPSNIAIEVQGQESLYISDSQELCIETGIGICIVDSGLDVFYADDDESKIDASFILKSDDTYSFDLGAWDNTRTMIIDPLIYSTFLGGTGSDGGNDITVNNEGYAYVTGQTDSLSFITTPGILDEKIRPSTDLFAIKLSGNGNALLYSTFIGGTEHDVGTGIAVDSQGSVHITGITYSEDFPTTDGGFDRTYNGVGDAFIIKLSKSGISMVYSTFLGGAHDDRAQSIAVDSADHAYVTGETWSTSFPVTQGALNGTLNGDSDIFVTKLNFYGDLLDYSTFLGGSGSEQGTDILVDEEDSIFVTGATKSANFPVTEDVDGLSQENAFVIKLSKNGFSILYSRLIGGSGNDFSNSIALDAGGQAYITGRTDSADFPITGEPYDENYNGQNDIFMAKLSKSGDSVLYSTYLGGNMDDEGMGISLEVNGTIFITGYSASLNFPTTLNALSKNLNGEQDGFIVRMDNTGSNLLYSSFLGGENLDLPKAIDISNDGCAFITGNTLSEEFPVTNQAYDEFNTGGLDGFVMKLDVIIPVANAGVDIYANESSYVMFNGTESYDNAKIVNYTWTLNDGVQDLVLSGSSPEHFFEIPGTYRVNLKIKDQAGNMDTDRMYLRVLPYPYPVANAGMDILVNQSSSISFNGSASWDRNGIESYRWSFNDGINDICLIGESPAWTFSIPGNYEILLNVTDANLNWDIDHINVTVVDVISPTASVEAGSSIEEGSLASFDGSGSIDNVGIRNYTWTLRHNDTNTTLYGANQSFRFWTSGNYIVTLNVTDYAGNNASNVLAVIVSEPEIVPGPDYSIYYGAVPLILSLLFLIWAIFHYRKSKQMNKQELEVDND